MEILANTVNLCTALKTSQYCFLSFYCRAAKMATQFKYFLVEKSKGINTLSAAMQVAVQKTSLPLCPGV